MALDNKQVEALSWILIFSGLAIAGLGVFVQRSGEVPFGWVLIAAGVADAAAGVLLIWWRSRRPD